MITYIKPESVDLACNLLDDTQFRPELSTRIKVEVAKFDPTKAAQKNTVKADPKLKKKRAIEYQKYETAR